MQSDFTIIGILYISRLTFLPVDHSRVILKVPDKNGSDYINASYIEVGTGVSHSRIDTLVNHENYESNNLETRKTTICILFIIF